MKKNASVVLIDPRSGSGYSELDPKDIAAMPLAQYHSMAGNFVNAQSACYYDTAVYAAASAITPAKIARLFVKGKGQDSAVVNSGTAIAEKGEFMT
ncbi:MAG: hypothetical protein QUS14_01755, partial [Pyrinomonadaceae bacterium]|nr:hypothetical protein [Pyrinomonadaceae bacterium]